MSKEIKLTQGKIAIVDDDMFDYLNQWKWFCYNGYAARNLPRNKHRLRKLFMHHLIISPPDGMEIDHKNRNRSDNRRDNLRVCSHSQNIMNRDILPNNTSGKKGVSWDKVNNKWRAVIKYNYKYIHIGRYNNIEDASDAFHKKAKELFGEFAYQEA